MRTGSHTSHMHSDPDTLTRCSEEVFSRRGTLSIDALSIVHGAHERVIARAAHCDTLLLLLSETLPSPMMLLLGTES